MTACSDALQVLKNQLSSHAARWGASTAVICMEADNWDDITSSLRLAAERAKKLERVQAMLVEAQAFHDIIQVLAKANCEIATTTSQGIQSLCDQFSANIKDLPKGTEQKWSTLASSVSLFGELSGLCWKSVHHPYWALCERLRSELLAWSNILEVMARDCQRGAMLDGNKDAKSFLAFQAYVWFDSYLDSPFVQDKCDAFYMIYHCRMESVLKQAQEHSKTLQLGSIENVQKIKECHQAFAEIKQFKNLKPK